MKSFKPGWVTPLLVMMLILGSAAAAAAQEDTLSDLNGLKCKDVMRLSGEDRSVTIGVLHGILIGRKGTTRIDAEKLGGATDQFIEHCLDHHGEKALSVMESMTK